MHLYKKVYSGEREKNTPSIFEAYTRPGKLVEGTIFQNDTKFKLSISEDISARD